MSIPVVFKSDNPNDTLTVEFHSPTGPEVDHPNAYGGTQTIKANVPSTLFVSTLDILYVYNENVSANIQQADPNLAIVRPEGAAAVTTGMYIVDPGVSSVIFEMMMKKKSSDEDGDSLYLYLFFAFIIILFVISIRYSKSQ
jgi:hypothetical protein